MAPHPCLLFSRQTDKNKMVEQLRYALRHMRYIVVELIRGRHHTDKIKQFKIKMLLLFSWKIIINLELQLDFI